MGELMDWLFFAVGYTSGLLVGHDISRHNVAWLGLAIGIGGFLILKIVRWKRRG